MNAAFGVTLSAAATAFDEVAASYDELFTHTSIGRAQRKQVWMRLLTAFPPASRILELNCGTGEDARFLALLGHSVLACDASAKMIQLARDRAEHDWHATRVHFLQLPNEHLRFLIDGPQFDGAFSDFAGLNCVADLRPIAATLAELVRPGGRLVLCLLTRVCVAETLWYLLHAQPKKAVRRFAGKSTAWLGRRAIAVFYPTARKIRRCFSPWFRLTSRRTIGLFVPPSYCEPAFCKHQKLLRRLESLDRFCAHWPVLRGLGDHLLLEFVRC